MMLPVLYEDPNFVVIDKPAGLPVHAGPRRGPSVEDYFGQFSRRKNGPWLAHRLDADTAGCLVIALRKAALLAAQAEFAGHRVEKIYWALVAGRPAADSGTIDAALLKISDSSGFRMVVNGKGDTAITDYRVLDSNADFSLVELRPRTGRTHQLRVHCAVSGFPILGDPIYGIRDALASQLMLLARAITLRLSPVISAQAPPHTHMQALLRLLPNAGPG